ncbi:MAG TPA: sugar phosphate isomerase/epimerase [Spirochaetia bacterium]|nr:sugar phosphate isomerase/epimerase [Spirochaetia bacterium]
MIGVSPAYFISRYGDRFSPQQVVEGLDEVAALGFEGFQLEVYHEDTLDEWVNGGAAVVAEARRRNGLEATQFVAHFLLHGFASEEAIGAGSGILETEKILTSLDLFPECRLVTVPLGAFSPGRAAYRELYQRFLEKIGGILRKIEAGGRRCAIELAPSALVSGSDGLLKLYADLGSLSMGYNFDTGHANACKEVVPLIPLKMGARLYGTHLCDNHGNENLKLCPGDGSIDWSGAFGSLAAVGYDGSFDVEIRCEPGSVTEEYRKALRRVRDFHVAVDRLHYAHKGHSNGRQGE